MRSTIALAALALVACGSPLAPERIVGLVASDAGFVADGIDAGPTPIDAGAEAVEAAFVPDVAPDVTRDTFSDRGDTSEETGSIDAFAEALPIDDAARDAGAPIDAPVACVPSTAYRIETAGAPGACSGAVYATTVGLTFSRFVGVATWWDAQAACAAQVPAGRLATTVQLTEIAGPNFDGCAWPDGWSSWSRDVDALGDATGSFVDGESGAVSSPIATTPMPFLCVR